MTADLRLKLRVGFSFDGLIALTPADADPVFHAANLPAGSYNSAARLVAALNAEVATIAALARKLEVALDFDRLVLRGIGGTEVIEVDADRGNAAVRDLGFAVGPIAAVDASTNLFIEKIDNDPMFSGNLSVALQPIGSEAFGEAYVGPLRLMLVDPRAGAAAGGSEIGIGFGVSIVNVLDANNPRVNLPDFASTRLAVERTGGRGTIDFGLADPVRVTLRYGDDRTNNASRFELLNLFPEADNIQTDLSGDVASLAAFGDLDLTIVLDAVRAFADWLTQQEAVRSGFGMKIPGFDANVGQAVGIGQGILDSLDEIAAGAKPTALQELEQQLNAAFRAAFGLTDDVNPFRFLFDVADGDPVLKMAFDVSREFVRIDSDFDLLLDQLWDRVPQLQELDALRGEIGGGYDLQVAGRAAVTVGLNLAEPTAGALLFEADENNVAQGVFLGFNGGLRGFDASFGSGLFDAFAVTGGSLTLGTPAAPPTVDQLGVDQTAATQFGQALLKIDPADGRPHR